MLTVNGNIWGADVGSFLFANGNVNLRPLSFPLTSAMVAVSVIEGASLSQLETFAREFPKEFVDFTQAVRHDLWAGLKHLAVSFEDVWLRIIQPRELVKTSFAKLANFGEVALIFVINVHGRCDKPAVAASFQGISCSPDVLRSASAAFARVFTRHTTHRITMRQAVVISGLELTRSDQLYFSNLSYISTYTVVDSLRSDTQDQCDDADVTVKVTMTEIHNFLFPPPPRIPVERFVATRTTSPSAPVVARQSVSIVPTRIAKPATYASPMQRQITFADPAGVSSVVASPASPIVVRRREAPWTATSFHNPATTEFAPQRTVCTPATGPGLRTSTRPSIAVTSPAAASSRMSLDDSTRSDVSGVTHVVSKIVSTPVRRWAQRGAAVPEPSPSIRL